MSPTRQPMAERLLALSRMNAELCTAKAEPDLLASAGYHGHRLLGADWVGLAARSADGRQYRLVPLHRNCVAPQSATDLPGDRLSFRTVAEQGEVVEENDLASSPYRDLAGLAGAGMSSAIVVPLRVSDRPLGALTFARIGNEPFTSDDSLLARQAGAFLASSIANLRATIASYRAETDRHRAEMILGRRADELDTLNRLFDSFGWCTLAQAVALVTREFVGLRGIELCRLSAVDPGGVLRVVATAGEHGARFLDEGPIVRSSSPDAIAVSSSSLALWRRPKGDDTAAADLLRTLGVTSVFSQPIMVDGVAAATLTAGSTGGHRLVTDEHLVMASIVGDALATKVATGAGAFGFWSAVEGSASPRPAVTSPS